MRYEVRLCVILGKEAFVSYWAKKSSKRSRSTIPFVVKGGIAAQWEPTDLQKNLQGDKPDRETGVSLNLVTYFDDSDKCCQRSPSACETVVVRVLEILL